MTGRQRQRAFKAAPFEKLRAVAADDTKRAGMSSHRWRARQEAIQEEPLFRAECRDAALRDIALESGTDASNRAVDGFEVSRRMAG